MGIIHEENRPIMCKLGGFHILMSFLGSIGTLMKGCGIEDLFAEVYAENSISHIMSGKAISRSIRAHIFSESALMTLLLELLEDGEKINYDDLRYFYQKALSCELNDDLIQEMISSDDFITISNALEEVKKRMKVKSRTAQLWFQYLDYISIVKLFILSERTSNWEIHLRAISKMSNLFAATGHMNYAKCARLYVQEMKRISQTYPWLYSQFMNDNTQS